MRHLVVNPEGIVQPPPYPGQAYTVLRTLVTMHPDGAGPVMVIEVEGHQEFINPNIPLYQAL